MKATRKFLGDGWAALFERTITVREYRASHSLHSDLKHRWSNRVFSIVFGLSLAATPELPRAETLTVVHAGTLLNPIEGRIDVSFKKTIVIAEGVITRVSDGFLSDNELGLQEASPVRLINAADDVVFPGMIDGHVHLTAIPVGARKIGFVTYSDADRAIAGAAAARQTLLAGFTTVRDLGARGPDSIYAVRDGIERGDIPGPRIVTSGQTVTPTGGHIDRSSGFRSELHEFFTSTGVCDGADDCMKVVRQQVRDGADAIKLTATGGVLSAASTGVGQQFTNDELLAIVEAGHALGRKVTAHAHGLGGINAALDAGADSIEHGTFLNQSSIQRFKKADAFLVPTLLAGETISRWAELNESPLPDAQKIKARAVGPQMRAAAGLAHRSGVRIALGSDSGMDGHGKNCGEFVLLVKSGLSNEAALLASFQNAAENLGMADRIGRVEEGYYGDLAIASANPLERIEAVCDIKQVIKGGVPYLPSRP